MRCAPRYLLMLVGLALPAAVLASLAIAASTVLMDGFTSSSQAATSATSATSATETVDRFSSAMHSLSLHAARAAVLTGAPPAVGALTVLLIVGGFRRYPRDEEEAHALPSMLGRIALACAALALIGLSAQFVITANFEANIANSIATGGWSL